MSPSPAVRVKLLGAPALERGDGTPVGGRPAQRHRIALVALLSLAPDRRMSRDKLVAWLWPEADAERARNLLNVAAYVLRSALGDEALVSAGDELRLGPGVASDVAELEAAVRAEEWERAAALGAGPFLDGFFLADAPGFEHWAERERQRLAALHRRAVEALAERAEREGRWADAVEWWTARAADDPLDSRVAVRLIEALEAGGNRAAALRHAADHQRLLAEELGMAPDPALAAAAERLRQTPDRRPSTAMPAPAGAPVPIDPPSPRRRRLRQPLRLAAFLSLAGMGAAGLLVGTRGTAPAAAAAADGRSIVVLPFVNMGGDSAGEYFSDGLTEEVITRLSAVPELRTISRTSAMRYRRSDKALRTIARELDVTHALEGSVRRMGDRIRITAQLLDARTDGHLWAQTYDYDPTDAFGAQEAIAAAVAEALEVRLSGEARALLGRRGTADPEAHRLYQRGRYVWNTRTQAGHEQALGYFREAIARDSGYADAYAAIADVYGSAYQLGIWSLTEDQAYSRVKWAAEQALARDAQSADAHTAFAVTLWCKRNWVGAERELRRALELNPGHATARAWYAQLLAGRGRLDEAVRESRRAAERDPFNLTVSLTHGWACWLAGDLDCAAAEYRRALEIDPEWRGTHTGIARLLARRGAYDSAAATLARLREARPGSRTLAAELAEVRARAGRPEEAARLLGEAKTGLADSAHMARVGFALARAHAALGESDSAFAWLARSDWTWPLYALRADPSLDPIRGDPRFAALSERVEREMGLR